MHSIYSEDLELNNFHTDTRYTTTRDWKMFTFLGSLYFPNRKTTQMYSTYYVLAKRGTILMTNAFHIKDTIEKIYTFFRHQPETFRWVFTFRNRQVNLARWFAWETDSDAYMQVSRNLVLFAVQEHMYILRSRYLSYNFLYFMGCDVAFIFTSFEDEDHYLDFKDKGIPTIGFDGGHHTNVYTYGLPGGLNSSTVLVYARVMAGLLNDIRKGHWFWTLANQNFII